MKKIFFIFVFYYSLFITHYSFGQWIWQNPLPFGNQINDFWLFGENSLIAIGEPGIVIKTTNGGSSWIDLSKYSQYYYSYRYTYFLNENTGWIQNDSYPSDMYKTTDGGKNWQLANNNFFVYMMKFLDNNTGYSAYGGGVVKSTNGGINWSTTNFPGNNINWTGLDFYDVNTGWKVGYLTSPYPNSNFVYKTTNGGLNWTNFDPGFSSPKIGGVKFVNALTGWLCGDTGMVRKTTNGGINWFTQSFNSNSVSIKLNFYNDQTGWVSTNSFDSTIYRTTNGGTNWIQTKIPIMSAWGHMKFFNQYTGYIFGDANWRQQIIKTTNGGQNWFFLSSGQYKEINSIYFVDENYGWAIGGAYSYIKTTNGGNNWILENNDLQGIYPLNDVYFKDHQTGWLLAGGAVLKTTNSGANWNHQYDTSNIGGGPFGSFSFKNENEIFIPRGYCIFRSTNGGTNWFRQYINNNGSYWISKIKFSSPSNGWLISNYHYLTDSAKVYKSTDGGQSWTENLKTGMPLNNIFFLNSNTGWVVANKTIFKTTNGGINWTGNTYSDTSVISFDKIYFENENTGLCISYDYLHKTTNGGINWTSYCMSARWLSSMYFLNPNTGWICNMDGAILKTTNGGNVFVKKISSEIPKSFSLSQNYPNPFNPNTIIRFQIKDSRLVTLKVYNILGKEVATLVNEKLNPGIYEIPFSVSQFSNNQISSGVYFYKLTCLGQGNFSEVKKMILIK